MQDRMSQEAYQIGYSVGRWGISPIGGEFAYAAYWEVAEMAGIAVSDSLEKHPNYINGLKEAQREQERKGIFTPRTE